MLCLLCCVLGECCSSCGWKDSNGRLTGRDSRQGSLVVSPVSASMKRL